LIGQVGRVGQVLVGRYHVLDRIGGGRLGELYRARDTSYGRTVALRVIADEIAGDEAGRQRFVEAARAAAAVSHPNVAALYEVGEAEGRLFLACEFVPGRTLAAEIAGIPLNRRRAFDIGVQLADALAEAHASGIVHGALTTARVIVTPKGTAKLLDTGLRGWSDTAERRDERSDIRALGLVIVEMLTGRPAAAAAPRLPVLELPALDALIRRCITSGADDVASAAVVGAQLRSFENL